MGALLPRYPIRKPRYKTHPICALGGEPNFNPEGEVKGSSPRGRRLDGCKKKKKKKKKTQDPQNPRPRNHPKGTPLRP
ncbi:hypothetical protein BU16DRAFT_40336 [Lophium mytilinum]|uniref:Uncharacterized protein n=1 Tax=Lophium mytilinum TaxID=390894 RepID=A0A6A6QQJ5_9PEZI|nr:hypothetical protein BU16DRAFT_40336 [Lophium mytilinum]